MAGPSAEVKALLTGYLALPVAEQREFLGLLNSLGKQKVDVNAALLTSKAERDEDLLYDRISNQMLAMRGVRMPHISTLKEAGRKLLAGDWLWLTQGKQGLPRETKVGLMLLAAESIARETRVFEKSRADALQVLERLPTSVNRAYPGYQQNGMLIAIAQRMGAGLLPVVDNSWE